MDPIDIIMKALFSGISKFTESKANDSLNKSYSFLIELIKKRFNNKLDKEDALDANKLLANFQSDPHTWEKPIEKELCKVGADRNPEILEASQKILIDNSIDINSNTTQIINNKGVIDKQEIIQNQYNQREKKRPN